ncbi:molybdopterin-synthase adenylyltransferase MoeB [Horticoccus luteus]|uniref:Molybdopterin-synthase adenylyltransferase n=1 Tax=Horticoccus luteus TaxID=2862869 RepID=A0A8F9TYB7_9BACT|nr:molybdopterin-synthase adenylyltransferase MoeB [Horticoccus luteus]QYM80390.1 molybdopterin-synthase adenylyltransferase MoeB [Horticoccus luteus]
MSLSSAELARYSRHVLLGEIGLAGQERLQAARVLIVGAGGLGSPVALYLAAAGVGTLGLVDPDAVELHNLQRQILHDTAAIGELKVASAATRVRALNPHIAVITIPTAVTAENADSIFGDYDIIVDGTDNFFTRYICNDAAVRTRRPLVHGSIFKFSGQLTVYDPSVGGPCHRCLFPQPPPVGSVPGCGEAGVVGALCGVIGSLLAMEVVKLITQIGAPLLGRLVTYDALSCSFAEQRIPRDPACPACGTRRATSSPAAPLTPASMSNETHPLDINVQDAHDLLHRPESAAVLIDVREPFELDICRVAQARHIPMREIAQQLEQIPRDRPVLLMCHHGGRSLRVTQFLRAHGFANAFNLHGGIDAWATAFDPAMTRY